MMDRDQIERLMSDLAANPDTASVVHEADGSWTIHDHRTG
jgi:hypothetical protein